MRATVVQLLRQWHAVSVENPVHPGTPDVNFVNGWVELKWLREWPINGGVVQLEHFTQQQRIWLLKRWNAGGFAWLLLQCRTEWLLFSGPVAFHCVGHCDRESLIAKANKHWLKKPKSQELYDALTCI